jgi:hypothetical protein
MKLEVNHSVVHVAEVVLDVNCADQACFQEHGFPE